MKELGYYNGKICELSEMMIPASDRACWFGDGVYEAQLCRNYRIFTLDEHVDRLFRSAAALEIQVPLTKEALKALLCDLVKKMDTGDLSVYYQVTRGSGKRNHAFPQGPANLWVTITPRVYTPPVAPVSLMTAEDTRFLHCNIKTLNLIPSVIASQRAAEAGCYECVLYRAGGRVTECSHSNVHIIKNGVLYTAPADHLILAGIARAHLIRACEKLGIPVSETPFTLEEMLSADEVITTSSYNPINRACRVDGKDVGMKQEKMYTALREELIGELMRETEA